MNSIKKKMDSIIDRKKNLKESKKLFNKNKLHLAEKILLELIHHGYNDYEVKYLLGQTYDKLAYLTGETDFEDQAMDIYDDLINFSDSRRYRKKAIKALNKLAKRISSFDDDDMKAQEKASQYIVKEPSSPKAWFILGANFSVRKDPFFVLNAYNNAIKLAPNYIHATFRAAYLYHYNLEDLSKALKYYLRLIKIDPLSDTMEPETNNIKLIIEACSEISEIYINRREYNKILSILDHSMAIYQNYKDKINAEILKRILVNSLIASKKLNNFNALKQYIKENYNIDMLSLLKQLRIEQPESIN